MATSVGIGAKVLDRLDSMPSWLTKALPVPTPEANLVSVSQIAKAFCTVQWEGADKAYIYW